MEQPSQRVPQPRRHLTGAAGVPRPRRVARRVPAGSPQWVLLHMLRDVLDPAWAPGPSAARLVEKVPQAPVLHHTRARLRAATSDRTTVWEARALATLNLAIDHLEHGGGRSPRAAAGGGVGEQGEPGRR